MTERYPLRPLVDAIRVPDGSSISRVLGISGSALLAYEARGMEEATAERLACRAGFHPSLIWPDLMLDAIADLTRECASPDCSTSFVLKNKGAHRRYCNDNCRDRTNARLRYQSDAPTRERKRAAVARYEREVREAKARREARKAA